MAGGKRNYEGPDTALYFAELMCSRMRACLERKDAGRAMNVLAREGLMGQLDGASCNEHRFVQVPPEIWRAIGGPVEALAKACGLAVTLPDVYFASGTIMVRFHRR